MPIVPWGHLRFTSKSHLSLSEPEPKYIDVQPPLGLTEKCYAAPGATIQEQLSHSSLNMVNLTSFSQMSPKNGDKWDWLGTFEIDRSMPIVKWGHLRFTSKSHLSLSEPESKYIDVKPPLGLTEKWDWLVNLICPLTDLHKWDLPVNLKCPSIGV